MESTSTIEPRWYIVHTYSSQEARVKTNLDLRVANLDLKDKILEVVVPTEEEIEVKEGQRKSKETRIFPGYVLIHMSMDEESWYAVRNTPGVTGFVTTEDDNDKRPKPVPLADAEVEKILNQIASTKTKVQVGFEIGQTVRITDGPFLDFLAEIDEIYPDRSKVKVLVSFFGRETPVELDFLQVEKT